MEIPKQLKKIWKERHWTTRLVWSAGAIVFTLSLLFILTYPPIFHAIEGLQEIEGEVTAQGVINTSIGIEVQTNISCNTIDDCPPIGGVSGCSNSGYCVGSGAREEVNGDSFAVRSWDGKVTNVVAPGLNVGEHVKLAVNKDGVVVERGDVLWADQELLLKSLLSGGYFYFKSFPYHVEWSWVMFLPMLVAYVGWGLVSLFVVFREPLWVRLLSAVIFFYFFFAPVFMFVFVIVGWEEFHNVLFGHFFPVSMSLMPVLALAPPVLLTILIPLQVKFRGEGKKK